MNILLVEDNEGDILLTQEALYESNPKTQLTIVRDGEAALDFLFQRNRYTDAITPDLVLLDINIPKMNGHEVLRQIRSDDFTKLIPVVFLTTSTADSDIVKAYHAGVNCYVVKDFIYEDLNDVVEQVEKFWNTVVTLPPRKHD